MRRLALLIGSLWPLFAASLAAQEAGAPSSADDPPGRVARISYLTGTVSFQPSPDTTWSLATVNYPLTTGDRLYADRGARAELQVGSLTLRVGEGTDLTVTSLTDQFAQIGLAQGTLRVSVYALAPGDTIEIDTPRGSLALLATGEYRVDAPADDNAMVVAVDRGSLQWTAGGVAQMVQSGQAIQVSGINPIEVAATSLPARDAFDQWSADRDRKIVGSASAKYVSRDVPGYADLDDAGVWETDAQYGPVWYPSGLPGDWAPYRHGHWVWIDPWGWTWVEREPWGYAPFHYGRWAFVGSRWGWMPGSVIGRPYYAPALVVFVDGSGFQGGAQAWFPLGPREPYHPWYHAGNRYEHRLNAPTFGRAANIPFTTNVTTIPYRNRRQAMTVVPTTTFRSGLPVSRRIIPVTAAQIARARIAPHPLVVPGVAAEAGGNPRPATPRIRRPTWAVAPAPRSAPPLQSAKPLVVRRNVPAPRPISPVAPGRQPAPAAPPVLITRHAAAAPAASVPGAAEGHAAGCGAAAGAAADRQPPFRQAGRAAARHGGSAAPGARAEAGADAGSRTAVGPGARARPESGTGGAAGAAADLAAGPVVQAGAEAGVGAAAGPGQAGAQRQSAARTGELADASVAEEARGRRRVPRRRVASGVERRSCGLTTGPGASCLGARSFPAARRRRRPAARQQLDS